MAAKAESNREADDRSRIAAPENKENMANVRPLRDRVLVKRFEEKEQKAGSIIIPDTAKEKPQQAEVVAVGSGRILENGTPRRSR